MRIGSDSKTPRAAVAEGPTSRLVAAALASLALSLLFAAPARAGDEHGYVAPELARAARDNPNATLRVIVSSSRGRSRAEQVVAGLGQVTIRRRLDSVGALAVDMPARAVDALARARGLEVVPDAPVRLSGYSSGQLWPYASGASWLWGTDFLPGPQAPTIAIVDSGIAKDRADFGGRVVADVDLSQLEGNSAGDGRGHGTFVAAIAAGSARGYAGVAPNAKLVSLDVMDDTGKALTSDVIAAAEWILAHKAEYNIRVANFSLHSTRASSFTRDPLNRAVERLWFSGVVVVAAAGNYGTGSTPSGVKYAPGNDPFVITVGATDLRGTATVADNVAAPWSAYGRTPDGFAKPELAAPGRYMVSAVPIGSTLAVERASNLVAPGYLQLSGTSFAAPVVAGAAAQILARHPNFTPDQVKGALMRTARPTPLAAPGSTGVGELNAAFAAYVSAPPNPNLALNRYVATDTATGSTTFDGAAWMDAAKANPSWDTVSWEGVSWAGVSWDLVSYSDVSYSDVSYSDVSYSDVSYSDVSYSDVSYSDVSYEDAVDADVNESGGYPLTATEEQAVLSDPLLTPAETR